MFFKYFVVRRIRHQLESLDDRMLNDIGISRSDIGQVAAQAATRRSGRQH